MTNLLTEGGLLLAGLINTINVLGLIAVVALIAYMREHRIRLRSDAMVAFDELTGVHTRGYGRGQFDAVVLSIKHGKDKTQRQPSLPRVAVALFDLDAFKIINDRLGHLGGDAILREVGALLRKMVRPTDIAYRFGGDEFVVVLLGATEKDAAKWAEEFRIAIAQLELSILKEKPLLCLRVSIGVASTDEVGLASDTLFRCADEALYASKDGGRDKVTRWSDVVH